MIYPYQTRGEATKRRLPSCGRPTRDPWCPCAECRRATAKAYRTYRDKPAKESK